jgi:AAA domain (dynein-related subfamily)
MPLPICSEPKYRDQMAKFLKDWPLSRVRTMPLSDYTRVNKDDEGFRGSFCYALEQETPIGIGGGNAMKFGIYEFRRPSRMANALQDDRYAWHAELGKTAEEAYSVLRSRIVAVIEAALAGEYVKIDAISLPSVLKWKLAFLYQNPEKPGIVGCAAESAFRKYFKDTVPDADTLPISTLHAMAIEKGPKMSCVHRIGWALYDAANPDEEEDAPADNDNERSIWNFSYGQDDADGINDLETLLRTGQIRGDWQTGTSLEPISEDKKQGKLDALDLLDTNEGDDDTGRRPTFNFFHMGIPKGAVLTYVGDTSKSVEVIDDRRVKFQGELVSMTDITQRLRGTNYYVGPMPHWTFNGERLSKFYDRTYPSYKPKRFARMCWLFAKKMKQGDVVFARQSATHRYIAGIVTSDYQFDGSRDTYQHVRDVMWLNAEPVDVPEASRIITQALTDITNWEVEVSDLCRVLAIDLSKLPAITATRPSANKATSMNKPTNVILYGPPGTGKTFHTKEHAVTLCNGKASPGSLKDDFAKLVADKRVAFVTFHQSYDYSDFIIGFKPVPSASGMSFEVRKGILMRLAEEAEKNPHLPYLLIIDEINRGNISKIFGELITLIEADKRRDGDFPLEVTLPCAFKGNDGNETCQFSLPSNVHLLGTMNTADRSIALLDTALRRRFKFVRKEPKPELLHADLDGVKLPKLLTKLNVILTEAFSPDHQIGHAWLPMKFDAKATSADLIAAFEDKILPLLDEWYYDDANGKEALVAQLTEGGKVTTKALKQFSES